MNEEQQIPQDMGMAQPVPLPPMGVDPAVHKIILDNNEMIDELMLTLRGQIVDVIKNEIRSIGDPIVSDEAISWIVGRILPYTSKIFSLSILEDETIAQMVYEFETDVALDLMFPERRGVNRQDRDYIMKLIVHLFVATIHKARGGQTLKRLLEQHAITETTVRQEREKKGILSGIFNPKKNMFNQ